MIMKALYLFFSALSVYRTTGSSCDPEDVVCLV